MNEGALRFWELSTWRDWMAARWERHEFSSTRRSLKRRLKGITSDLAANADAIEVARRQANLADSVQEIDVPFRTRGSEVSLAVLPGVVLFEQRSRDRQMVWVPIGPGTLYFTSRRMVYQGRKRVDFRYDRLTGMETIAGSLVLGVSNRKRPHRLEGPVDDVLVLFGAVQDHLAQLQPSDRYRPAIEELTVVADQLREEFTRTESELAQLKRADVPPSPAWAFAPVLLLIAAAALVISSNHSSGVPTGSASGARGDSQVAGLVSVKQIGGNQDQYDPPESETKRSEKETAAVSALGDSLATEGGEPSAASFPPESSTTGEGGPADGQDRQGLIGSSVEDTAPGSADPVTPVTERRPVSTTRQATTTSTAVTTSIATTTLATTTTSTATTADPRADCDPSYPSVCIPRYPPDLDCSEIPYRDFSVVGSDPHGFDRDRDGIGCES